MSVLSDYDIKMEMSNENIVIEPFNENNLSTSSYDVTLGNYYYKENTEEHFYNPYNQNSVESKWKLFDAMLFSDILKSYKDIDLYLCNGINMNDNVILLYPGENILAHTNEYIGGKNNITSMMKARSSFGRSFIKVCGCAGWGDVGYVNRWTMEITNNSSSIIPLVVGRRIAQIIFFRTGDLLDQKYSGKYNDYNWEPENMLPKLYLEKEALNIFYNEEDTESEDTESEENIKKINNNLCSIS